MTYEVCPNSTLFHNGVKYPAGALAPAGINADELCAVGAIRLIESGAPERPEPIQGTRSFSHAGYDPGDPETVTNVPLRLMPALMASVDDEDALYALHAADTRKGGRDLIEERLGELEVGV